MAGLCHACYGTDGYDQALLGLDERPVLTALAGVRAESLVYLYGSCDRAAVYPARGKTGRCLSGTGSPAARTGRRSGISARSPS